jgi:hypothetical protein
MMYMWRWCKVLRERATIHFACLLSDVDLGGLTSQNSGTSLSDPTAVAIDPAEETKARQPSMEQS